MDSAALGKVTFTAASRLERTRDHLLGSETCLRHRRSRGVCGATEARERPLDQRRRLYNHVSRLLATPPVRHTVCARRNPGVVALRPTLPAPASHHQARRVRVAGQNLRAESFLCINDNVSFLLLCTQ